MPRPDVPRPAPLNINHIKHDTEEASNEKLDKLSIVGSAAIIDEVETLGELGSGNGGFVTKVRHKPSNQILARKVIRIEVNAAERNRIIHELEVLKHCDSPYIVGYFGACHRNGEINLFMEYMDGKSLDSILKKTTRIREDILGRITVSVIEGLTYLREKMSIMHRDIKPSNILVNSHGQIKICDFGVSGHLVDSIAQSFVGTRQYMAPERLLGNNYNVQSDIWSLGLTLVELALGVYPIPQHDPMRMYEGEASPEAKCMSVFALMNCIVHEPPPTIPGYPIFSVEFKDFVDRCLKKNPEDRFDLRTIVQHPFVIRAGQSHVDVGLWVCQVCSGSVARPEQRQSPQVSPANDQTLPAT